MCKDKRFLYEKAYNELLKNYQNNPTQDIKPILKRLVFYGVRAVNHMGDLEGDDIEYNFQFAEIVKSGMALFTPREFMTIFPIDKTYDGKRWETKDYFSTMEYINSIGIDNPVGEQINHFLWDYMNTDIFTFLIRLMCFADDLRQSEGLPGIMEEFFEKQGAKAYTLHTDNKGKQYLFDSETGKTIKVKPKVKHLKVIK